jgi:hypothetical protein
MPQMTSQVSAIHDSSHRHPDRDVRDETCSPRLTPEELIHELRQPLSVIECLAYHLELISSDKQVCEQVQRIQAMIRQANGILERAAVA